MVSDERIIERVLKGHTEEYRELMKRYQAVVFRTAYGILGRREEAEDAAQETFLKAYRSLASCRGSVQAWLRRIVTNVCLDRLPRETPSEHVEELLDAQCFPENPVEIEALRHMEVEGIRRAISGLPAEYRAVVVLKYEEGLSYKEISDALGEPVTSIQVRLHRAKKMLAQRLEVNAHELL